MKIVIIGPKAVGKSVIGQALARELNLHYIEIDNIIEDIYTKNTNSKSSCREIYTKQGKDKFRELEKEAVRTLDNMDWKIIITGGSTFLDAESRKTLRKNAIIVYCRASLEIIWKRINTIGLPPWLDKKDGKKILQQDISLKDELYAPFADILLETSSKSPEELTMQAKELLTQETALRSGAANTYGEIVRVTTFGESHGKAIGAIMEGIKPGFEINETDIQQQLDRRKPGQSSVTSPRQEADQIHILSGVFEGKTTGAPIAMIIYNKDQDPSKYDNIKHLFRPGHADYTFYKKYGLRDHRGGGRSSGRETATRVATGAIAMKMLEDRQVQIIGHAVEIAGIKAQTCDYDVIESNPVRCADPLAAKEMEQAIHAARKDLDSVGGIIQLDILGLPPGLGDPVFGKLDARLVSAIMSIGALKGVEIGDGFASTCLKGSQSNDRMKDGGFLSNTAGGITGGISNGQSVILRVAVKPTSSIAQKQQTINIKGKNEKIEVRGRHDPCIVPRAVPVVEHMAALTILDAWEIQSRLRPDWDNFISL